MAYQALYRKWRPLVFDDVIGQGHIVDTIKNEICSGRVAHAYLFTGTRGTGKTTTAKILSRAVNCLNPKDGNPCNECENCKEILNETSLDVQEIDAASNTGVDNVRNIIDSLQYLPASGKYKVYIIDEVHMLSKGAFNALLKTIEEPPSHVIFILATTEVQKIPATILSRCQRFDFKTISIGDIVGNLKKILSGEGISADDDALEYVAFLGDGSMRDSLSILDRCLAFSNDNLTVDDVTDTVGAVDDVILYDFASYIAKRDTETLLKKFNDCVNSGKNCDNIANGLLLTFREILMYKVNRDEFAVSRIKRDLLSKCADDFDIPTLIYYIDTMGECLSAFKNMTSQRVICECSLIKLSSPEINSDSDSLLMRISALEKRLAEIESGEVKINASDDRSSDVKSERFVSDPESGILSDSNRQTGENIALDNKNVKKTESRQKSAAKPELPSADNLASEILKRWSEILTKISSGGKILLYTDLYAAHASADGEKLCITVDDEEKKHRIMQNENMNVIKDVISSIFENCPVINVVYSRSIASETVGKNDVFSNLGDFEKKFPQNIKFNADKIQS